MTSLTNILGGPWAPPAEQRVDPPETQLRDAMLAVGLEPPEVIHFDGKIHRFRSGTKGKPGHDKPGWYLAFGDGVPAGRFGCWRAGIEVPWRADIGRRLSEHEEAAYSRRMAEAQALRDAALKRQHDIAAETVLSIWTAAQAAHPDHPYLARKGIQTHGARVTGDGRLIVPLYDDDGTLSSLQYIGPEGGKMYHPGGQTGGKFWIVGTMDEPGTIYIAEGFATAATIHEATGRPCIVAYSASSLVPVTEAMRERYGAAQDIVIVADHDSSGVGQKYADQASAKFGARVLMPPIPGMDANDYAKAGHDLAGLLTISEDDDWLIRADDFSAQPAPISWLVKRWVQDQALVMVHGPSGGGKTFVVLDWCLRMASETLDWHGHKVKPGTVVYLAGEGHHGLRSRIAAWKHRHKADKLNMWLSREGCDLNTAAGYLKVVEQVRKLPTPPRVIVVDTLHRFLNGDENSAQDAKTMLDACGALMREFNCTVILVHHTGVSEDAQHRARGSSAWRGALDIEISIIPAKGDDPMQVVQRKSKDAELAEAVFVRLESVEIPGWFDEDGQAVTSAVVAAAEGPAPKASKVDDRLATHRRTFEAAWVSGGQEDRQGRPYLSRSAMMNHLTTVGVVGGKKLTPGSAEVYIKPGSRGKAIAELLEAGVIEQFEHGWLVVNEEHASSMLMQRNSGTERNFS